MNVEGSKDPLEGFTPQERFGIEQGFKSANGTARTKLHRDYINSIVGIDMVMQLKMYEKMQRVATYEEYLHRRDPKRTDIREAIINLSDADAISRLNQVVAAFNKQLEEIKKDKNNGVIQKFRDEVIRIVNEPA